MSGRLRGILILIGALALILAAGVWEWQTPSTSVVDWLNGNGAAVTATATVVLAGVTWRLAASSLRAAQLASEATLKLTRSIEGLPFVTVTGVAPDSNNADTGPCLRFGNRGHARAEDVRVRIESLIDLDVGQPRQPLSDWLELGGILPGSEYPVQGLGPEGESTPRYVCLPITRLREEWGSLEHHEEWLATIEYRSVAGTWLCTTCTQTGKIVSHVDLSQPTKESRR